ncbi:CRISPR-associated endoribonuclease Cas6 [Thermosyntropha sp.]|uniref:CRISPR-associated endoribonuclease Cas6 n=1 Tax=Thermosyntropha sp. TaxID=2740820 RepID=UPI00260053AC|nr:CRISPR-associated endoribonuclease Cas6 [Thermosyntropha sp.]MBO8159475.1 CRISPR-associated endoribonuclease Cas6 [Thermosyntropha sp.]
MRITVNLTADKEITLPQHYNHIVQGFIYRQITDKDYRDFLHNQGYKYGSRSFKLFTFSKLLGDITVDRDKKVVTFASPVRLVISSPVEKFITDVAETLIRGGVKVLGNNLVEVEGIKVHREPDFRDKVLVKMLSPVVAYSTEINAERKKTRYYSPWEEKFTALINQNLHKKFEIINREKCADEIEVIPVGNGGDKFSRIIYYKNFIVKGYDGDYWLRGNPELIKIAYNTGLGSKNSQGFGCFEIKEGR